jgi:hypothetical protein
MMISIPPSPRNVEGIPDAFDCNIQPVDRASVSIPQFDALGPDARVSEGDPSSALCWYAIIFDRTDDEDDDDGGVYDMTVTVSAEPPGQL